MMSSTTGVIKNSTSRKTRRSAVGTRDIHTMRIEKVVGSGMYGVVYKAVDKETSEHVALKRIKMDRETQGFPVTAIREIKILSLMKNENIVCLKEIVTYNDDGKDVTTEEKPEDSVADKGFSIGDVFMVFEFVDYDLCGLLKSPGFSLSDQQVKSYMKQLLSGVKFLHDHKILHRDIKSANLLITKNNVLKIADWGLARTVHSSEQKLTNPVVTLWYRSPEVICGSRFYGPEVDIWSVGCLFGEMKTKIPVFRGDVEPTQLDIIFQMLGSPTAQLLERYALLPDWGKMNVTKSYEKSKLRSRYPSLEPLGLALFEKLLDIDPQKRISAENALKEPYFTVGRVLEPEELPELSIEPVTEFLDQERLKKETEARRVAAEERARLEKEKEKEKEKEEQQKLQSKHVYQAHTHYNHHHHHHHSSSSSSSSSAPSNVAASSSSSASSSSRPIADAGRGGGGSGGSGYHQQRRGSGGGMADRGDKDRDRGRDSGSKYKIVKPDRSSTIAAAPASSNPSLPAQPPLPHVPPPPPSS